MPESMRSTLAKFKCGVYTLAIETGRYSDKPVEQTECLSCPNDKVEDEFHFLLLCPAYQKERTILLKCHSCFQFIFMISHLTYFFLSY